MAEHKNFIRILSLLLCVVMTALLCACSGGEPAASGDGTESIAQSEGVSDVTVGDETEPTEETETATSVGPSEETTDDITDDITMGTVTPETVPETLPEPQTAAATTEQSISTVKETEKRETAAAETTAPCAHKNTEIKNKKDATTSSEGYTGDTYCRDCGKKIAAGEVIPTLTGRTHKYTLPDGSTLELDESINPREYTMRLYSQKVEHQFEEIEHEILRLCNIERAKEGLSPLAWYEDAYCFTKIRADETIDLFSHTRPNGESWDTVYKDANVLLRGTWGENLFKSTGYPLEGYAELAVGAWMDSPGHRANIMNPKFTHLAVAISQEGNAISATQNFFG